MNTVKGLALAALLLLGSGSALAGDALAGAKLYREARWTKSVVAGGIEGGPDLPRRRLACAGCHGREPGLAGANEGGLAIPALSWSSLGRRGLTTPAGLTTALTTGRLADGTVLGRAMPRFALPEAAASDLLAYLEAPEAVDAPGVTADTIRLGILVPEPLAARVESMLADWAAALNDGGGVWGRRVSLVLLPGERRALDRQLALDPVLAIVAGAPTSAQETILAAHEVIELAPLTPLSGQPGSDGRVVALGAGLVEMAVALGREILARRPGPRARAVALLLPHDPDRVRPVLDAVRPFLDVFPVTSESLLRDPSWLAAARVGLLLDRPPAASLAGLPPGTLLAGPIDILAEVAAEPGNNVTWLLADPRADTLAGEERTHALDRHLVAATRLTETGLLRAGRRLTRISLLAALAAAPVDLGGRSPLTLAAADRERSLPVVLLEAVPATGELTRLTPLPPSRP